MRTIKFKARWRDNSGHKEWAYFGIGSKPVLIGADWITPDLQYLGMDANGKDIYEDDLVLGQIWNQSIGHVYRVKFDEDSLSYFPFNDIHETSEGDESLDLNGVEVVGNFYENPKEIEAYKYGRYLRGINKVTILHKVEEY